LQERQWLITNDHVTGELELTDITTMENKLVKTQYKPERHTELYNL
jgi:hypothetical protein